MRVSRTRKTDATFDLNLAPVLDIIVAIVPMLLLSVAFIQVRMIEAPVPQVVADAANQPNDVPKASISLRISKQDGYLFSIMDKGQKKDLKVALLNGKLDFDALKTTATQVKKQYFDVFKLDLLPADTVSYDEIVKTIDQLRKLPGGEKVTILDTKTGQQAQTDLMFPDVVFSNVIGD